MTTGYLTAMDLIAFKILNDSQQLESGRIGDLIIDDLASEFKQEMIEGVNYFHVIHDIEDLKKFYYVEGVETEDIISANNKVPHAFYKGLVNQKTSYIAGNPITIGVDLAKPENVEALTTKETKQVEDSKGFLLLLDKYLGTNFNDLMVTWIQGASNKATEWIHFYVDTNGELNTVIVPSEECIPIYDTQYENKLVYMIRYYEYDYIDSEFSRTKRYKVEWWTETDVTYYAQVTDDKFIPDPDYDVNPAPHWTSKNSKTPINKKSVGWGEVPFVCLKNNTELLTDLHPVKLLIDAYDKVKNGWMNDLEDFQELVLVLRGYSALSSEAQEGMSELAVFLQNLKTHKVVSVDEDGGVEALKVDIPTEAKTKFLEITRNEIFYFGEGVDVDSDKFGNNPSGISLRFLYGSLDLKANRTIRKLEVALYDFFWFVVEWVNMKENKKYDSDTLTFTFNKTLIFNEKDRIDSLDKSGELSLRTRLENHPFVTDVEEEMKRIKVEKEEAAAKEMELFAISKNDDDDNNDDKDKD